VGIVVTLAMLAGLFLLLPTPVSVFRKPPSDNVKVNSVVGGFLLTLGLWNAFWYGLRHVNEFWGQAAIGSGLVMVASATVILVSLRRSTKIAYRWFYWVLIAVLLVSFLLYAITLVQLNLGMEIVS